jgi:hypothetical protein
MSEPLTPEEARAKIIAELMARPGPKPQKPIPPEVMAEILAADQMPYEEAVREYQALLDGGGSSLEAYLEELKRKYTDDK